MPGIEIITVTTLRAEGRRMLYLYAILPVLHLVVTSCLCEWPHGEICYKVSILPWSAPCCKVRYGVWCTTVCDAPRLIVHIVWCTSLCRCTSPWCTSLCTLPCDAPPTVQCTLRVAQLAMWCTLCMQSTSLYGALRYLVRLIIQCTWSCGAPRHAVHYAIWCVSLSSAPGRVVHLAVPLLCASQGDTHMEAGLTMQWSVNINVHKRQFCGLLPSADDINSSISAVSWQLFLYQAMIFVASIAHLMLLFLFVYKFN